MNKRQFTKSASEGNPFDDIPLATHEPQSLRETLNRTLMTLSSEERLAEAPPIDERTEIPEVDPNDLSTFLAAVRRALIHGGIGKEPE